MKCCKIPNIATLYGYINGPAIVLDEGSKTSKRKCCYGFQSCDDIEITFCLNCGQIEGTFPKVISEEPIQTEYECDTYAFKGE